MHCSAFWTHRYIASIVVITASVGVCAAPLFRFSSALVLCCCSSDCYRRGNWFRLSYYPARNIYIVYICGSINRSVAVWQAAGYVLRPPCGGLPHFWLSDFWDCSLCGRDVLGIELGLVLQRQLSLLCLWSQFVLWPWFVVERPRFQVEFEVEAQAWFGSILWGQYSCNLYKKGEVR